MIVYTALCILSFMCTYSVVYTHIYISKSCLNAYQQYHRSWSTILTHSQMTRVCALAFLQPPYLFVFPLKVHHPPLESSESHAVGAALKVCQRGEAPGPGLESPIATQSPRQRTSPVQGNSRTGKKRGAGRRPLETHGPSTRCFKTTQIRFHCERCRHCWMTDTQSLSCEDVMTRLF